MARWLQFSPERNEEVMYIIANSPRWTPAKQRGRPVRQCMVLPFVFQMQ
ncbi:hypothetical protein [Rhodoflexus caldus]|nr:hypothetical protein [Rhodoflexus caldus]